MSNSWVIPSRAEEVAGVLTKIVERIESEGFSPEAVFAVRLALDEALINAIKHGNKLDDSKTVAVDLELDDNGISITIEDEGPGYDPCSLPDPTAEENLSRPCGRGVMLMHAYMTKVKHNTKGNRVTLVKTRDCRLPRR